MNRLLILFFFFLFFQVEAQIVMTLKSKSNATHCFYNMDQADLYFILSKDTFFIPKMDKYKFHISDSLFKNIEYQKDSFAKIVVVTGNFIFITNIDKHLLLENHFSSLGFFKSKKLKVSNALFSYSQWNRPYLVTIIKKKNNMFYKVK